MNQYQYCINEEILHLNHRVTESIKEIELGLLSHDIGPSAKLDLELKLESLIEKSKLINRSVELVS